MTASLTHRQANRLRLRESLLDAARRLTIARGWDGMRMADVADAAGVSRQTLYNEFDGKGGLAQALVTREIEQFVTGVRSRLSAHGADVRAGGYAAILHTLTEAASNPLVRAILTSTRGGADDLLPFLTTRSDIVLVAAGQAITEWATVHLPHVDAADAALAVDTIVRLVVSHIVLPLAPPEDTATRLAEVLVRLLR